MPVFLRISRSKNIFLYSSLFVIFIWFITRLQYFLYYPVLVLSSDSASYCSVAFDMLDLNMPIFDIRTPGYPVFLSAVWMISKTALASAVAQSLFTLAVSLFFVWVISRTYREYVLLFAVLIAAFTSSSYYLVLEDSILTEGIFVSMLLLSSGLLILSVKKNKSCCWALFSASVAIVILIRPAGIFMAGIMVLVAAYFLINKFKFSYYLALGIPFAVIILSLCAYNYATLRLFTITPFGEANLSGVTILFMEPSPEYPELVNKAIQNTLDSIPRTDINVVRNYNNVTRLYEAFNNHFYRQLNLTENMMKADPSLDYVAIQPVIRMISMDAIKKNPKVYAKFIASNFLYFFYNINITMGYYEQLTNILKRTFIEKKYIKELESDRWKQISSDRSDYEEVKIFFEQETNKQGQLEYVSIQSDGTVNIRQTFLKSVFEVYETIYNFLFRNIVWLIIYFTVFIFSVIKLVKSKIRDEDALLAFLFCMIFLMKAILVSLVEVSLSRYSYTVEYALYFSLPFALILTRKHKINTTQKA